MKKFLLTLLLACGAVSVGFGGEFEDCISDCKAKNFGNALANFECQNNVCAHLNPALKDSIKLSGGDDQTKKYGSVAPGTITGDFTGNHAPGLSGGEQGSGSTIHIYK